MSVDDGARRLIMLGGGGHARVLQETLAAAGRSLGGYIAPERSTFLVDTDHLGGDEALDGLEAGEVLLVNGLGSVGDPTSRRRVFVEATARGFSFATVVDPSATVRSSARIGHGAQILAGSIVNSDAVVGDDCIVNSGAIIEHHATLGAHTHVAPGAVIGGSATVGESTHVGLGARLIQGVAVGSLCTIGAGAVVIRDVSSGVTAVGVPAVSR
ncbi:hypothetical protein ASE14_05390 [Agromyces sp. Root81]|nr:hypothetical protein ASE14_05390 [Agromyces sp. Root81]